MTDEHSVEKREETIVMYSDGASRGNPGPSAVGVFIETLGKSYGERLEDTTNNDAEYRAILLGLKKIKSLVGKKRAKTLRILCRMDSQLAAEQLNHRYKIEHPVIRERFLDVWNLMLDFGEVAFEHVPREENREADRLANEALDGKGKQTKLL